MMPNEVTTYLHDGVQLPYEDWTHTVHSFGDLTAVIQTTHDAAQGSAVKAINRMQTMRNWLIGYYIVEFEQRGKDRADYGAELLKKLEERVNRRGLNETLFKNSRSFYQDYPQMADNLHPQVRPSVSGEDGKSPTVSDKFKTPGATIRLSASCFARARVRRW